MGIFRAHLAAIVCKGLTLYFPAKFSSVLAIQVVQARCSQSNFYHTLVYFEFELEAN